MKLVDQELMLDAIRNDARARANRARRLQTTEPDTAEQLNRQAARLHNLALTLEATIRPAAS